MATTSLPGCRVALALSLALALAETVTITVALLLALQLELLPRIEESHDYHTVVSIL